MTELNNHQIIIRHFKTHHNKINYSNSYKEAVPYINFINKYINKYNITDIEIITSPLERTLMTSLIIYIKLCDTNNIKIHKPKISKYLERDPSKERNNSIKKYFNKNYKSAGNLVLNITHSSIYSTVFTGIISGMNDNINDKINIDDIVKNKKISEHSLSFINDCNNKIKYGFNLKME
jgi:hypothetical protein